MAHANWRFVLADSNDLSFIGELTQARGKQLDLMLNRPGSCRFTIPLTDPLSYEIKPIETCILAFRDVVAGVAQLRWSGPVWTIEEGLPDGNANVGAVGWYEELNVARLLRDEKIYGATNPSTSAPWKDWEIVQDVLATVNAQTDTTATVRPTKIEWGGYTDTGQVATAPLDRQKTFAKGTRAGQAIQELSDIEAGFDMETQLDTLAVPWTPKLYLWDKKGQDRPGVVFGYNTGARNLQSVSRNIDGSKTMNRMLAQGKFGSALAEDTVPTGGLTPIQRYGMFEEWANLSEVVNDNILLAYAGAEVILRSHPLTTYSLVPFPVVEGGFVPRLFDDYDIGDTVYFSVKYGRLQLTKQAVRVFGASISIDEESNERIQSLQTSPSG
jgi:hypothetical protein